MKKEMQKENNVSETRARVFEVAGGLFYAHGYSAVTMRDIANALGVRQASLYYHVPDGKEQLFTEVIKRGLIQQQVGLQTTIANTPADLEAQLRNIVEWFVIHPPFPLLTIAGPDVRAISEKNAQCLLDLVQQAFFAPIVKVFQDAIERNEIRQFDPIWLAGAFLSLIYGISSLSQIEHISMPVQDATGEVIDILLNGLRP